MAWYMVIGMPPITMNKWSLTDFRISGKIGSWLVALECSNAPTSGNQEKKGRDYVMARGPKWSQKAVEDMLGVLKGKLDALETASEEELARMCVESLTLAGLAKASREVKVKELTKRLWKRATVDFLNDREEEEVGTLQSVANQVLEVLRFSNGVMTEINLRKCFFREFRISGNEFNEMLKILMDKGLIVVVATDKEKPVNFVFLQETWAEKQKEAK